MAKEDVLKLLEKHYEKGITLFAEGDTTYDLFILLAGSVGVYKNKQEIGTIDAPGSYFGEMSFLLSRQRTATARTLEFCRFLVIPPDRVADFFSHSPALALKMAKGLAERLAGTTESLADDASNLKKMSYEFNAIFIEIARLTTLTQQSEEARRNSDISLSQIVKRFGNSKFLADRTS